MKEENIIGLLGSYSAEIAVSAVIATFATFLFGKLFKVKSSKALLALFAFFIGAGVYAVIALIMSSPSIEATIMNLVTAGALSATVTVVIKKTSDADGDVESSLKNLLSQVVVKDKLDEVTKNLVEKLSQKSRSIQKSDLKDLLADDVVDSPDDGALNELIDFLKTLCDDDFNDN